MGSIQFLGAALTVTGSSFILEHDGRRVLVDCGLFQGDKALRLRNWAPFPIDPKRLDAVVLTHAHIDHTGGLPRLVKQGFRGPVYSTPGTRALAGLLLPDSARLQEEEARYANAQGYSKHKPALPLYDGEDAARALRQFESFSYGRTKHVAPGIDLTFHRAGHILGSAICDFHLKSTGQRVVFSGDLGRYDVPILRDPEPVDSATTLVVECTYGDRLHDGGRPLDALAEAVHAAAKRQGMLVIPAFAIGRTQELLYSLRELEDQKRIPALDVFVDSPMACDATPIYAAYREEHDLDMTALMAEGRSPFRTARTRFAPSVEDSRRINDHPGPGIIISASGMATGGRILHHLAHRLPDPKNTVMFVGFQSHGTRGRRLLDGERELKIHGRMVPVAAQITSVSGFSAHGDWKEVLRWAKGLARPPEQTFLVHGEPKALAAMEARLKDAGWPTHVPSPLEQVPLAAIAR